MFLTEYYVVAFSREPEIIVCCFILTLLIEYYFPRQHMRWVNVGIQLTNHGPMLGNVAAIIPMLGVGVHRHTLANIGLT